MTHILFSNFSDAIISIVEKDGLSDEIRQVFKDTKKSLIDVLRLFDKNPNVFTFYDYRVKDAADRNIGWRIDHMLASQKLADLAEWCRPDIEPRKWERPSDHTPLVASFKL